MVQIKESENLNSPEMVRLQNKFKNIFANFNGDRDHLNDFVFSFFDSLIQEIRNPSKKSINSLREDDTTADSNGFQENDRNKSDVQHREADRTAHLNGYQKNDRNESDTQLREDGAEHVNGYQQKDRENHDSDVQRAEKDRADQINEYQQNDRNDPEVQHKRRGGTGHVNRSLQINQGNSDYRRKNDSPQPPESQRSKKKNVSQSEQSKVEKSKNSRDQVPKQPEFDAFEIIPKISQGVRNSNASEDNWDTPKTVSNKSSKPPQQSWRNQAFQSNRMEVGGGKVSNPSPKPGPSNQYVEKKFNGKVKKNKLRKSLDSDNWDTTTEDELESSNNMSLKSIHLSNNNSKSHSSMVSADLVDLEDNFVGHEYDYMTGEFSTSKRSENSNLISSANRSKIAEKTDHDDDPHNTSSSSKSRSFFLLQAKNRCNLAQMPKNAPFSYELESVLRDRRKLKENSQVTKKTSVKPQKSELTIREKRARDEAERKRMFLLNNYHPYFPRLGGAYMVGDDYFLRLARNQLHHGLDPSYANCQSGYCVSGQTIKDAYEMILDRWIPDETLLLINIGYEDVLSDTGFFEMMYAYQDLLESCNNRGIVPIAVTLAPMPSATIAQKNNLKRLNGWIKKQPLHIDIANCLMSKRGSPYENLYYRQSKYVTGSRHRYTFWNHMGEKRVLECIKDKLADFVSGDAITDYKEKLRY